MTAEAEDTTGTGVQASGIIYPVIAIWGTFGGTTVTIELSPDGSKWGNLKDATGTDVSITAENVNIPCQRIPSEYLVRAVTTGGSSASINVTLAD